MIFCEIKTNMEDWW